MEITIPFDRTQRKKTRNISLFLFCFGVILITIGSLLNNLISLSIGLLVTLYIAISYFTDFLKYRHPPLILNEKGIIDNIDVPCYGLIEWKDITTIRMDKKFKAIILIDVKNETKYLNQLNVNRRFGQHYKTDLKNDVYGYGTVVFINVKNLSGDTNKTFEKILDYKKAIAQNV